jgi:hypothetical protein
MATLPDVLQRQATLRHLQLAEGEKRPEIRDLQSMWQIYPGFMT